MYDFFRQVDEAIAELATLVQALTTHDEFKREIAKVASVVHEKLAAGGMLYTAGNGGSAAEAQHLSAEFIGRYRREREPYPAMALTAESAALTAIGNDYSFEDVFARQMQALGKPGDVFVALTTSGNSTNILRALEVAREKGVTTVALLGKGGGKACGMADYEIIVPSDSTAHVQEVHLLIIHALCESFDGCVLDG